MFRAKLRKSPTGTFRRRKPGEIIEGHDLCVHDCFFEAPSDSSIGQPVNEREMILQLEVGK